MHVSLLGPHVSYVPGSKLGDGISVCDRVGLVGVDKSWSDKDFGGLRDACFSASLGFCAQACNDNGIGICDSGVLCKSVLEERVNGDPLLSFLDMRESSESDSDSEVGISIRRCILSIFAW